MSMSTVAAPALALRAGQEEEVDRYEAVRQYSGGQIAALWAAAAAPMSILAWIVAPWLSHHLGTSEPLATALICFNAGLLWVLVLTLVMVRLKQGGLDGRAFATPFGSAPRGTQNRPRRRQGVVVADAVRAPFSCLGGAADQSQRTAAEGLPQLHRRRRGSRRPLLPRGLGVVRAFGLLVFLAPVVEELFFRGLLLPRMQKVCGRFDWIVNGTIFTAYHLHQPWGMPTTLLTGIFGQAYPAKRFRSIWISIVCHTLPSFLMIGIFLSLVLSSAMSRFLLEHHHKPQECGVVFAAFKGLEPASPPSDPSVVPLRRTRDLVGG